jgi:hypothetical protein
MATLKAERLVSAPGAGQRTTNGAAAAAFLGAGIGSFATGMVLVLDETGIFSVPALYEPAGGVSGRTTLAMVVWLVAWALLHARWKEREIRMARVTVATVLLVLLGIVGTFPPFWSLL